jgi:hypothetical protein
MADDVTPRPPDTHRRPDGVDDATVAAVGKLTEGWEWVERVRGHLYELHQLMGHADATIGEAADLLEAAGHAELAEQVRVEAVGRNVLRGRWTFQIVEEFDEEYYRPVGGIERRVRDELMGGRRHVFEAELKEQRRTHGHRGHERRPPAGD